MYKSLAHPEWDGFVTPYTLEERLAQIEQAKRMMPTRFTWLCDSMDNALKHAMGDRPNSEFVIDPDGIIVKSRNWSDPEALRADLAELVGPVEDPTTVDDLDFVYQAPPKAAAEGVVPRLEKPGRTAGLEFTPEWSKNDQPWYAKLRAEADRGLLMEGDGKLYLGFRLDPIYGVHWNNIEGDAIRVKLEAPEGVRLSETYLEGPEVTAPADIDPREFLVDVEGAAPGTEIGMTVSYFACSEEEGWCKPIEQKYTIRIERNPDHFWVFDEATNDEFNRRIGRTEGKPIDGETATVDSRLPGTPPPEMVERMNEPSSGGGDGDR